MRHSDQSHLDQRDGGTLQLVLSVTLVFFLVILLFQILLDTFLQSTELYGPTVDSAEIQLHSGSVATSPGSAARAR